MWPNQRVPTWKIPFSNHLGPTSIATQSHKKGQATTVGTASARAQNPNPDPKNSPLECKTKFRNKKNKVCHPSFLRGRQHPPHSCEASSLQAGPSLGTNEPQLCQLLGLLVNPLASSITARKKKTTTRASEILCSAERQRSATRVNGVLLLQLLVNWTDNNGCHLWSAVRALYHWHLHLLSPLIFETALGGRKSSPIL